MQHYTYLIVYQNNMRYIGVRSCKCLPEEDTKYIGSSKITPNDQIAFKQILKQFKTRKEAINHEIELHELYDVAKATNYYNRCKQISTGFDTSGAKITRTLKHNLKIKQKLTGRKRTEKECLAISLAKKGKPRSKPHSQETRKKMSKSKIGFKNKMKGKHFNFEDKQTKYKYRVKYPDKYKWFNKRTGETKEATCREMGYLYNSNASKPSSKFCILVRGNTKEKSFHGWVLITDTV